jgi:hypothetical protein
MLRKLTLCSAKTALAVFTCNDIFKEEIMMLRSTDYRPVKLPLSAMSKLGFEHWRTQWRAPSIGEYSTALVDTLGCGISTWEISTPDMWAWINWDWAVLDCGLIAIVDTAKIRSNVVLLGEGDRNLPLHDSSAILMSIIHDLPWREEVENLVAQQARSLH